MLIANYLLKAKKLCYNDNINCRKRRVKMTHKVDPAVVNWIKDNINVTHTDLPIEYVRAWTRRAAYDGVVQQYAMFGYIQACIADGTGINTVNAQAAEFLEEFEGKLALRLFQELSGVQLEGFPMFRVIGRNKLSEVFSKEAQVDDLFRPRRGNDCKNSNI
jgi:hypothetical protein